MLNTFYKLISSVLAEILKPIINRIIGNSQKAYIPGKYIGEVTRTTYDIFPNAKAFRFNELTHEVFWFWPQL